MLILSLFYKNITYPQTETVKILFPINIVCTVVLIFFQFLKNFQKLLLFLIIKKYLFLKYINSYVSELNIKK